MNPIDTKCLLVYPCVIIDHHALLQGTLCCQKKCIASRYSVLLFERQSLICSTSIPPAPCRLLPATPLQPGRPPQGGSPTALTSTSAQYGSQGSGTRVHQHPTQVSNAKATEVPAERLCLQLHPWASTFRSYLQSRQRLVALRRYLISGCPPYFFGSS
jgi:hypothetical protein